MDTVKIGKYIAGKRKALGMTQAQVAEKLGMSDKSVSKWERGVCLPDVSVYMALCEILGISLNEFIAGGGTKISTEFDILEGVQDKNYYGRSAKSIDEGKTTIQPGEEMGILALYYAKNELSVTPFADIENGNVARCNDEVYYLTVTFEKDDEAWD